MKCVHNFNPDNQYHTSKTVPVCLFARSWPESLHKIHQLERFGITSWQKFLPLKALVSFIPLFPLTVWRMWFYWPVVPLVKKKKEVPDREPKFQPDTAEYLVFQCELWRHLWVDHSCSTAVVTREAESSALFIN